MARIKKASVDLKPRWLFVLREYPSCIKASQLGYLSMIIHTNRRAKTKSAVLRCKAISATSKHPKHRRLSLLSANCGGAERR